MPQSPDTTGPIRPTRPRRSLRIPTPGRVRTWLPFAMVLMAFGVEVAISGLPTGRQDLFLWIAIVLLSVSLADLRGWARGVFFDWLPFYAALTLYAYMRGRADNLFFTAHYHAQIRFDQWIGFGTAPTVRLQRWLYHPGHPHWYDIVAWTCYTSHFVVSFVVAAVLWKVDRNRFRRFIWLFMSLSFAGMATYALYPAMPPWLAAYHGYLPANARVVHDLWNGVGAHGVAGAFTDKPGGDANAVAAVPSLHGAYPVLLCLFFWKGRSRLGRVGLMAYPLLMGLTLVYAGEHYVFDVLLGWVYAAVVYVAFNATVPHLVRGRDAVAARWQRRARRSVPRGGGADQPVFAMTKRAE